MHFQSSITQCDFAADTVANAPNVCILQPNSKVCPQIVDQHHSLHPNFMHRAICNCQKAKQPQGSGA